MISSNNRHNINQNYARAKFQKKANEFKVANRVFVKRGGIKL